MWMRNLLAVISIVAVSPAVAGEGIPAEDAIPATEARRFLEGKWWQFSCYPPEVTALTGLGHVSFVKGKKVK
ncbi:hypothetical protein [Methylocystis sp.]|uniref:hypothetical protein n=1 Tax=Methylocystis sp. TaxID=1911079 RepID=UPI0025D60CB9|nr:hypothetical protein [Methylocystis sp.]